MTADGLSKRTRVLVLSTRITPQSGDGTPSFVLDNAAAPHGELHICFEHPDSARRNPYRSTPRTQPSEAEHLAEGLEQRFELAFHGRHLARACAD